MPASSYRKFADKVTENLANDQEVLEYKSIQIFARKKLELLLASHSLKELHLTPGIRLEKLRVKRQKYLYSIRINRQYRILFIWENNEA